MRRWKSPFYDFGNGEVGENFTQRSDTPTYYRAFARAANVWPLDEGGLRHRPGLRYVDDLGSSARMLAFLFDQEERYLLIATANGELQVRSTTGALLETSDDMPWNADTLKSFDWVQSGDTIIVCHRSFAPRRIMRTALTTFESSPLGFELITTEHGTRRAQPMAKPDNALNIELEAAATTGDGITVTASADYFTSEHIERRMRINGREVIIKTIVDDNEITVDIRETLTDTDPTADWELNAWNDDNGYPAAVTFHAQRLWFAGSPVFPNRIWGSKPGNFFDMNLGEAEDGDAIQYDLVSNEVQQIEYLIDGESLQAFTKSAVWAMPKLSGYDTTPTGFGLRRYANDGCRRTRPVVYDGATMFADITSRAVREVLFDEATDGYAADLVSLIAGHLISAPNRLEVFPGNIEQSEKLLFILNSDGSLAVFRSMRQERVTAWFPWTTDGDFRDVCVVGTRMFFIVERMIDGDERYYLERLDFDSWLDCSKLTNHRGTTLGGHLLHLKKKAVVAREDERIQARGTVRGDGDLVIESDVPHDEIGLEIRPSMRTLALDALLAQFPMHGSVKRVYAVHLEVRSMNGLTFDGKEVLPEETPAKQTQGDAFSGQKRITLLGFSPKRQFTLVMTQPSAGRLLGFTLDTVLR